jgi:nicotinamide phosphoribosyltransferase
MEDAYWATKAWNLFLTGTDDFHGIWHTPDAKIHSIPATAHKTMQQFDSEMDGFKRAIDGATKYESKMVALVLDTYDPNRVINEYLPEILKYAKDKEVHVVFRPDSGNLILQALTIWQKYSNWDNWSVIIGEGMSRNAVIRTDNLLKKAGFPLEKMSYGIGGGFYNHIQRDSFGHAMKTAYSNGKPRMKLVKTNPFKQSIPNMVNVVDVHGVMVVDYTRDGAEHNGLYYDVYHYDERSTKPKWQRDDWLDIQKRALSVLKVPNPQAEIVISPVIQQAIEGFKDRYG